MLVKNGMNFTLKWPSKYSKWLKCKNSDLKTDTYMFYVIQDKLVYLDSWSTFKIRTTGHTRLFYLRRFEDVCIPNPIEPSTARRP